MRRDRSLAPKRVVLTLVTTLLLSNLTPVIYSKLLDDAAATTVGSGNCVQDVNTNTSVVVSTTGGDCVTEFRATGSNTWAVPGGVTSVWVLVVGGGGGGGAHVGSGGGAGGVLESTTVATVPGSVISINVGAGGIGARINGGCSNPTSGITGDVRTGTGNFCNDSSQARRSANGGDSSFGSLVATGGGGGGSWDYFYPRSGGSGAGSSNSLRSAGTGAVSQGNSGGGYAGTFATGGGGGAGGTGGNGNSSTNKAGDGGVGVSSLIKGSQIRIGGGGGGGQHDNFTAGTAVDGGGSGAAATSTKATNGQANTGGGGGGSGRNNGFSSEGGDGGSGIVIIRYSPDLSGPSFSSASVTSNGTSLELVFNETLSATTAPVNSFTVSRTLFGGSSDTITVSSLSASGSSVTLNLASTVFAGDTVTISYVDPSGSDDTNALQDVVGNDVATFSNQFTINNSTEKQSQSPLTITSTTVAYGDDLTLTTSGGSGTGALTFDVDTGDCIIQGSTLFSSSVGSCTVTATKAADTNYLSESATAVITITSGSATLTIAFTSTTFTFGVRNAITVTVSAAGTVRFSANGRVIKNCKSISTIPNLGIASGGMTYRASCNYRPGTRGPLKITARLTPTDLNITPRSSTSAQFVVLRRTGVRG